MPTHRKLEVSARTPHRWNDADDANDARLSEAQRATPDWTWTVLGGPRAAWLDDPWPLLCRARLVITHAGQNAVAECAAARVPTLVIPQDRPYREQHATAHALRAAGLATVREDWPAAREWPALLSRAAARPDRWDEWSHGDGAQRAARLLTDLASRGPAPSASASRTSASRAPGQGACGPR